MPKSYIPDRGDIVWLHFSPQAGHEQSGHRPALVVSPKFYNAKAGLALFCPITSRIKGHPFEVVLPRGAMAAAAGRAPAVDPLEGAAAILSDQIKSLDWRVREAKRISKAPREVMHEVLAKIRSLIEEPGA